MNKHQFRAVLTAILALCTSFTVWTMEVRQWTRGESHDDASRHVHAVLERLFGSAPEGTPSDPVAVNEVTVSNLGDHFVRSVEQTRITASVTHDTVTLRSAAPLSEGIAPPDDPVEDQNAVIPAADDDLSVWELRSVWSISIPSLGIRAPVLLPSMKFWSKKSWNMLEEQMQAGLHHGAVAYPHSASPGENGTLIIAGHSSPPDEEAKASAYGNIFAKLPDIAIGDEITVQSGGEEIRYRVEDKFVVSPETTSILEQQSDESILKLITCYPVGTTRDRMVILGKKI